MGLQGLGTKPNAGSVYRILAAAVFKFKAEICQAYSVDIPLGCPVQPSLLLQPQSLTPAHRPPSNFSQGQTGMKHPTPVAGRYPGKVAVGVGDTPSIYLSWSS